MNSFSLRVQSLFTLLLFHTLRMENNWESIASHSPERKIRSYYIKKNYLFDTVYFICVRRNHYILSSSSMLNHTEPLVLLRYIVIPIHH